MIIKALNLSRNNNIPNKTELYFINTSRTIEVIEEQQNGTRDIVHVEYTINSNDEGYFSKEYRPHNIPKKGAKVIDITSILIDNDDKECRWYLYDIKDTLMGKVTIMKLNDQWNSGLKYIKSNILNHLPEKYTEKYNLGVITRYYDENRIISLKERLENMCNSSEEKVPLAMKKLKPILPQNIAELKVVKNILNKEFIPENCITNEVYPIQILILQTVDDRNYSIHINV